MQKSIFDYKDYRSYVLDVLAIHAETTKGLRVRLAAALDCQAPFVSQVLNGEKEFNHEQILKFAEYFELNEIEKTFLLDLLSYNRSSTPALKAIYLKRLELQKENHEQKIFSPSEDNPLSLQDQVQYYSHWLYAAVHMACTIPELQSFKSLLNYFNLTYDELSPILDFLKSKHLVAQDSKERYFATNKRIYVDGREPIGKNHHGVWRNKIVNDLKKHVKEDIHFTLCFTASESDIQVLREQMIHYIENSRQIISASNEEKLAFMCLDLQRI